MTVSDPTAELQPEFSSANATPTPWVDAHERLEKAEIYWLTTVRPNGRPHVTPLVAVWFETAFYFCTGRRERKALNLVHNSHCIIMTGCNDLSQGLDLVIEGDALLVRDEARLQIVADMFASKYEPPFHFTVHNGAFLNSEGGKALVYEVIPMKAFGFGKGETFSQTRWRF